MSTLQEYKCPCCDGAIAFDSNSQKMKCPFCGNEFEMETLASYDNELQNESESNMQWETNAGSEWQQGEADGLSTYRCNSCGGEIVGDDTLAASKCPYCGNQVVMKGQFSGELKPDLVIPFKVDKKAAKEALKKHFKGKKFVPKAFLSENKLDEIKGVYVPHWLFSCDAVVEASYQAEKYRHWSDSKNNYTETSAFSIPRTPLAISRAVCSETAP